MYVRCVAAVPAWTPPDPAQQRVGQLREEHSTTFSQEPCLGVKTNSNRFAIVVRYARVSFETCAEWLSSTSRMRAPAG